MRHHANSRASSKGNLTMLITLHDRRIFFGRGHISPLGWLVRWLVRWLPTHNKAVEGGKNEGGSQNHDSFVSLVTALNCDFDYK